MKITIIITKKNALYLFKIKNIFCESISLNRFDDPRELLLMVFSTIYIIGI